VDTELFAPARAAKQKRVLMVSRLIPWKGPQLSLQSFAIAARKHPNAMLEIVGDGPLLEELKALAVKYGIWDRVIFHGARDHEFVRERMRASRLLIQHCVTLPDGSLESQGLSVLEAMACGLPVVVTRHGAFVETVPDETAGYLVDEHDTTAMGDAIDRLLKHPIEARAMGEAGRRHVIEQYSRNFAIGRLRSILGLTCADERRVSV
jgi:colanic acid/amylovoran biosynthesis glycosyltransferase